MVVFMLFLPQIGMCAEAGSHDNEQHIAVAMRMIGHRFLLSSNDSTSRVLPVKHEDGRYKIQFDTEFEFVPEELVAAVDEVVQETRIASGYIIEVQNCETDEVVYSYEVAVLEQQDIITCKSRALPKDCYNVFFTILNVPESVEAVNKITGGASGGSYPGGGQLNYFLVVALLIFMTGVFVYIWKKGQGAEVDPNLISIGEYHFDKRNTSLLYKQQRIDLTNKEADLLSLLYDALNNTVEREKILNMVWGDEGDYVGRTLDVFISKLRKKLESDERVKIVNVRGVGYKLVLND